MLGGEGANCSVIRVIRKQITLKKGLDMKELRTPAWGRTFQADGPPGAKTQK